LTPDEQLHNERLMTRFAVMGAILALAILIVAVCELLPVH